MIEVTEDEYYRSDETRRLDVAFGLNGNHVSDKDARKFGLVESVSVFSLKVVIGQRPLERKQ